MKMQQALFAKIKETVENPRDLAKILQDALNLSPDAVYRRMRSETSLSIDEAYHLSRFFKISLSDLEPYNSN